MARARSSDAGARALAAISQQADDQAGQARGDTHPEHPPALGLDVVGQLMAVDERLQYRLDELSDDEREQDVPGRRAPSIGRPPARDEPSGGGEDQDAEHPVR